MRALDPQNRITVTYDLAECGLMSGERLAPLGLLVNEALVNSMKYAHPAGVRGLLQLSCRPVFGNSVLVAVEDDGVGLPSGVDHHRGGGMGFRIMRALAEQLGATLTCRSSALGLMVQVIAPI